MLLRLEKCQICNNIANAVMKICIADRIKCHAGFFGEVCEQNCSEYCKTQGCDINNGFCECKVGYAGNPCTKCPPNCDLFGCNDNFHCYTCKPGFYGNFCNQTCLHCQDYTCNRDNGTCKCDVGYAGHPCTECPINCDKTGCNDNFHCYTCNPGFYGDFCNQTCSEHCVHNKCDRDGRCSCNVGYAGHPCKACPKNCDITGCNEQLICDKCDPGFYGDYCNLTCSTNCINDTCNRDGSCICKEGFDGFSCCPENCKGDCNETTFVCSSCQEGFHGDFCVKRCPYNCKEGCTQGKGICNKCIKGYWGDICDKGKK